MQNLLVSGRKRDALQCAQEGQLWAPALVIASQLGDQVFCLLHSVVFTLFRRFHVLTIVYVYALFGSWDSGINAVLC